MRNRSYLSERPGRSFKGGFSKEGGGLFGGRALSMEALIKYIKKTFNLSLKSNNKKSNNNRRIKCLIFLFEHHCCKAPLFTKEK